MVYNYKTLLWSVLGCWYGFLLPAQQMISRPLQSHFANEALSVIPLFKDSLSSSFAIQIKTKVSLHKHLNHSEHVMVLSGKGRMVLGAKTINIKRGDLIFIPQNTPHAVKRMGFLPLRVLSIQSPYFDGNDRILIKDTLLQNFPGSPGFRNGF